MLFCGKYNVIYNLERFASRWNLETETYEKNLEGRFKVHHRSEKSYLKPSRAFVREVRVDFETEAS